MSVDGSKKPFMILGAVFASAIVSLYFIYSNLPQLPPEHKEHIKLPRDIEDAKVTLE